MKNHELLKKFREQDRYLKFTDFIDYLQTQDDECTEEIESSDNLSKTTITKDITNISTLEIGASSVTDLIPNHQQSSLMSSMLEENQEEKDSPLK